MKVKSLSRVRLSATPWTAAYQGPLSMGFPSQEYWSGVKLPLFLSPIKSLLLPSLFPCAFCHPIWHAPVCGLFCDAKLKSRHKLDFFYAESFVQFSYTRQSYNNWFLLFLIELGNLLCNKELTCPIALPKRKKEKK